MLQLISQLGKEEKRTYICFSIGGKYDWIRKETDLFIVKSVEFGVYLAEDMHADTKHQVLLPAKQVPEGKKDGDKIEVFIYKDSQDRLIATTNERSSQ